MFRSTGRATAHRAQLLLRSLQTLAIIFLFLTPVLPVYAQGGVESTGTGGGHKIQGRIYFPSGRRSDANSVKVILESTSSERLFVLADLNGSFAFQSLSPGSYYLTVEAGDDYEPARESVVIEGFSIRNRTIPASELARANVPRTFNVIFNLRLKRRKGASSDAAKPGVYDASLANLPKPAVDLYQKALDSIRANDSKKAVEQLKEAISYYPEFALALNELGVQYLRLGQVDKALEALRSSLRIKPDEFTPRLNYAIALLEKKETAEAEAQLRQALARNDTSWTAHMYLGITLISLRKYDEAEKELQRALSIGGDNLSLPHYYLGGIYWHVGNHKRAADELEKYLQLAPKAPEAERIRATIKDLRSKSSS
jgi:tetratricopeptide (TPR) repeat protein